MKLTPKFSKKDIRSYVINRIKQLEQVILDQLIDVAEEFVSDARQTDTYIDRTSNLRGSIGYVILKDGQELFGNFEGVDGGQEKARQFIKDVSADYPRGFTLIVVAGMEYAAYVEAKGFDVISASSLSAESSLQRQLNRLRAQLKKIR